VEIDAIRRAFGELAKLAEPELVEAEEFFHALHAGEISESSSKVSAA
jgi:hypothetical protein